MAKDKKFAAVVLSPSGPIVIVRLHGISFELSLDYAKRICENISEAIIIYNHTKEKGEKGGVDSSPR